MPLYLMPLPITWFGRKIRHISKFMAACASGLRQAAAKSPAVLSRVPLVRCGPACDILAAQQTSRPITLANIFAAILRFEFLSDFAERSPGLTLGDGLSTNLYSGSSVRFENSAQLVELELMKTERAYEESVHLTAAARSVQSA
jgi:hypothetical protein